MTCKFHHPQPDGIQFPAQTPGPGPMAAQALHTPPFYPSVQSSQQYGVIPGNWSVSRPTMLPGSYAPGSYGPMLLPPGVVPVPGWTPYTVCVAEPLSSPPPPQKKKENKRKKNETDFHMS